MAIEGMTDRDRTYDEKCYDLAQEFLADVKGSNENDAVKLADAIQQCIEDFVGNLKSEIESASDEPEPEPDAPDEDEPKPDKDEEAI